jgi:hypothetical protein
MRHQDFDSNVVSLIQSKASESNPENSISRPILFTQTFTAARFGCGRLPSHHANALVELVCDIEISTAIQGSA